MVGHTFAAALNPDYPGKHLWWTLRFVGQAPDEPPTSKNFVWGPIIKTEAVDGTQLATGDELTIGRVIGTTQVRGEPFLKIDTGAGSSQMFPVASLATRSFDKIVERDPRNVQLEYDGEPEDFDLAELEAYLQRLHDGCPLLAVFFQQGQWVDGEPLVDLGDEALVARLRGA